MMLSQGEGEANLDPQMEKAIRETHNIFLYLGITFLKQSNAKKIK